MEWDRFAEMYQTFTIQADTVLYFMYTTQNTKANLKYKYKISMITNIIIEAETYVFQKQVSQFNTNSNIEIQRALKAPKLAIEAID